MAPSAFMMPAATASPSSIPGATGTPSPRIAPWTFQDTAARVSEAGPLHGCTCGSGPPARSGSPDGGGPPAGSGGPPAPGAGGRRGGPRPRGPPPEAVVACEDPADAAGSPSACLPDVLAAVLPVEVTAPRRAADPIAPDRAADGDAPGSAAGRAPLGSVSALDPAWADAKGPAWPPGITPASMASAWSHCAGSVAWARWMWSNRSLGWRWVGRQCVPAFHVQ